MQDVFAIFIYWNFFWIRYNINLGQDIILIYYIVVFIYAIKIYM